MSNKSKWMIACLFLMALVGFGSAAWGVPKGVPSMLEVGVAVLWLFGIPEAVPPLKRWVYRS